MLHSLGELPGLPLIVEYLAGQFSVKLLQRELGLFSGDIGVWHPQDLGRSGIQFLGRLGHNPARPDVLAADEAEPIDPLLIRQSDGFRFLAHFAPKMAKSFPASSATIAYIGWGGRGAQIYWRNGAGRRVAKDTPLTAKWPLRASAQAGCCSARFPSGEICQAVAEPCGRCQRLAWR